jgi:hypothetical protein
VPDAAPHQQVTQNAPGQLQERLFRLAVALPGVVSGTAFDCVPGSRGFHLAPRLAAGPLAAFLSGTEFGHLHPEYDGSLHIALPELLTESARKAGWGEPHPDTGAFLLFGPRDDDELVVVMALVRCSYRYARGRSDAADLQL